MRVNMEARREKILQLVINAYVTTGRPVGSRVICNRYKLDLCPASVRNVMSDLEEQGFITHTHTSAGRVPTDKGYRFYVDKLLHSAGLTGQEQNFLNGEFNRYRALEEIIGKTSRVLSDFTCYTGLISQPEMKKSRFKRVQLGRIKPDCICVTLVTECGLTKSSVVNLKSSIDDNRLMQIENFLNSELEGMDMLHLRSRLRELMIQERNSFFYNLEQALELIDRSAVLEELPRFYFEGLSNILNLPEFRNSQTLLSLVRTLERESDLNTLVKELVDHEDERVRVLIGGEGGHEFMKDYAMVLSCYSVDNCTLGVLGIIGPKRMDYGRAIATVRYVSTLLNRILTELSL